MNLTFDPVKNRINVDKHGVDLADVEGVFYDGMALTREDRDHDEMRFVTLGLDGFGRLLVVVYTYRGEDEVRVISARFAEAARAAHLRRISHERQLRFFSGQA
ncbi:MAG: BrnT family toxin, partial [Burkholderiaceae bacterium]|nr:BrnT family toxin [Burkholderiaceae bacterium]